MISPHATAALFVAALGVLVAAPAAAQRKPSITGIDQIHAQARVGSKICMTSHEHYGEGQLPSRKGAEGAAIRAWQVFMADEYGSAWGSYDLAVGKSMQCDQTSGAWTCRTRARPCRSGR